MAATIVLDDHRQIWASALADAPVTSLLVHANSEKPMSHAGPRVQGQEMGCRGCRSPVDSEWAVGK
jgi:hypothetical protein